MHNQNMVNSMSNSGFCAMEYVVPSFDRIPDPLLNLDHEILSGLRVFDIDLGNAPPRHASGFGRHGGILSLSWCLISVEDKLDLDAGGRSRGQDALLCLMALRESAYSYFYREHRDFLQSVGTDAKLSITFLSTRYSESALWPDLFTFKSWCDSYWDGAENMYRSAKASYLSNVLCPIVEYGMSFDHLKYNLDKWVFSRFMKRFSIAAGYKADLKYFLEDVGETQNAMHLAHLKLIDLPGSSELLFYSCTRDVYRAIARMGRGCTDEKWLPPWSNRCERNVCVVTHVETDS